MGKQKRRAVRKGLLTASPGRLVATVVLGDGALLYDGEANRECGNCLKLEHCEHCERKREPPCLARLSSIASRFRAY